MYAKKIEEILDDIENKEIEIAGGSVVGIILATTNSLIKYISNLTIGKKKYAEVETQVIEIKYQAEELKMKAMQAIDKDKEVLEKILDAYKHRTEEPQTYQKVCKDAVEFCMEVLKIAYETQCLADKISKVGNKMLASDFKICKYYAFASVESAIVNVEINLDAIQDERYKKEIQEKYTKILSQAKERCEANG